MRSNPPPARAGCRRTALAVWLCAAVCAGTSATAAAQHAETASQSLAAPAAPRAAEDPPSAVLAAARAALANEGPASAERLLEAALQQWPLDPDLRLLHIRTALASGRTATALLRVEQAKLLTGQPEYHYLAAAAYGAHQNFLGRVQRRRVSGGQVGRFAAGLLLYDRGTSEGEFLCCPPESALFQIRLALDLGYDTPAAHLLHARIWLAVDQPHLAEVVLRQRAAVLLAEDDPEVLALFAEVALRVGNEAEFLRYTARQAAREPARREKLLAGAYLRIAERCSQRGDDQLQMLWLTRAVRLCPDDVDLLLQLGHAEWHQGNPVAARERYLEVLRLRPDHPERVRLRARLAEPLPAEPR